ncbi:MAG: hypothetical protein JXB18_15185 [Sedimentisphaerales bacterium]|nr:hypothetical protein [Sedimentisphaerales bacterium]
MAFNKITSALLIAWFLISAAAYSQGPVSMDSYQGTIKVACIGDSVVFGAGIENREKNCYPAQLQRMLGSRWEVRNYGINSRIMQRKGDYPYWNETYFQEVQDWKPDVVIISLGANDTKPHNWNHYAYRRDCAAMVDVFQSFSNKPIVRLCCPVPAYHVQWGINDQTICNEVIPIINEVAGEKNIDVIDNHTALSNKEALFGDKIHPNAEGAGYIARSVYRSLMGHAYRSAPLPGSCSDWYGYQKYDFPYDGRNCTIVAPKVEAAGRPWIWRARFFGHEPQTDLWLLARGFHVVYMDVADLFGAPVAVAHWNAFYRYLTGEFDFSPKPALEGMSRGGLIVMNWAKKNPNCVSCIYIDAPICDIRSWPGGKGACASGDPVLWKKCLEAYGLSEEEAETFADNPVDNMGPLAKANVPILSVCGDADTAAIMDENIRVLEKRYKAISGRIDIIVKEGVGHHPHSLKVPTPIVNFVTANTTGLDQCFVLRGEGLKNSQIRFEKDKQGRVVFLGGSITHMSGWRDEVYGYLKKRFPQTQFDFINTGIPSTGSTPGAFRLIRDVFSDGLVDLLFEDAAANDHVNGRSAQEQIRGMEGILRHARQINPKLDIVTMYFVDEDKIACYN